MIAKNYRPESAGVVNSGTGILPVSPRAMTGMVSWIKISVNPSSPAVLAPYRGRSVVKKFTFSVSAFQFWYKLRAPRSLLQNLGKLRPKI
jgi:hypothetical protein